MLLVTCNISQPLRFLTTSSSPVFFGGGQYPIAAVLTAIRGNLSYSCSFQQNP